MAWSHPDIKYVHSGNIGDTLFSLSTVISICREHSRKAHFYLKTDVAASYYAPNVHPLGEIRLSREYAEKLIPLLESQDYISRAEIYNGELVDLNLDEFRLAGINQSCGHIPRWYFYAFRANYNLAEPCLWVKPNLAYKDTILINLSKRYRNIAITHGFMQKYKNIAFIGLESEYNEFVKEVPDCPHVKVNDFLEMAEIIGGCKFLYGSQSFAFALAESIKVPRILQACPFAWNVIPTGEKAYDFFQQNAFEAIFEHLSESL